MLIESAVGASWQVTMRGPSDLTGGDRRALEAMDDKGNGLERGFWFAEDSDDEWELAEDGVSMVKRPGRRQLSRAMLADQRDAMLTRLITGWSFEDKLPMPYHSGYLDSDELPIEAVEKILGVYAEVMERLRRGGPKERPATTVTSTSTSPESSATPQPGSPETTAAPASGSPATAA
jgi:hypothetical protein